MEMMKILKFVLLVTFGCCLIAFTGVTATPKSHGFVADVSLMRFISRTRELAQQQPPQRTLACFDYYLPLLNNISAEYERSYEACLSTAALQRCQVDNSTLGERQLLQANAENACNAFSYCNSLTEALSYFECYADTASQNTKVMYILSTNASLDVSNLRQIYASIEASEYRCTNASERVYVIETTRTYEQLQSCLQGKSPVPASAISGVSTSGSLSPNDQTIPEAKELNETANESNNGELTIQSKTASTIAEKKSKKQKRSSKKSSKKVKNDGN